MLIIQENIKICFSMRMYRLLKGLQRHRKPKMTTLEIFFVLRSLFRKYRIFRNYTKTCPFNFILSALIILFFKEGKELINFRSTRKILTCFKCLLIRNFKALNLELNKKSCDLVTLLKKNLFSDISE